MTRFKEYTAEEIVLATDNFSWRLKSEANVGIWGSVYKGCIDNDSVSVKFLISCRSQDDFESAVHSLRGIRHPHLVSMLGFCSELRCFVYEHIDDSRLLHEVIKQNLQWHDRIRIASDVYSAICYIKSARGQFTYVFPDYLNASNIVIDYKLNAKVNVVMRRFDSVPDFASDIKTFGYLVLNLLTGIRGNFFSYCYVRWCVQCVGLVQDLDKTAGQWPMDLAEKLLDLCRRCVECDPRDELKKKYIMIIIVKEMNQIREQADDIVRGRPGTNDLVTTGRGQNTLRVPRQFFCPISKEVMEDPYVAADGFSYEREGIEKWLQTGHDTSPMTNLKLKDKVLTPNVTLKLLIKDWYRERSIPYANA